MDKKLDEIAIVNKACWEKVVKEGAGCTIPYLNLDIKSFQAYNENKTKKLPESCDDNPADQIVMKMAKGKNVLCLGAGGGQQSALFSLLGARVTVFDISQGQLKGDRQAAEHYGYKIKTVQGDMRDLPDLSDDSFDIIYGTGSAYIPDIKEVFKGAARVIRTGGIYRPDFMNPYTEFVDDYDWDGKGYRITMPHAQKKRYRPGPDTMIEFRHYLDEVFNGLIDLGFSIQKVFTSVRDLPNPKDKPGSFHHWKKFIQGGYAILAKKKSA